MEMLFVSSSILIILFVLIVQYVRRHMKTRAKFKNIPRPPTTSLPFIGQAMFLRGSRDELFQKFTKLAFDYVVPNKQDLLYLWLGPVPIVFINSPNVAEEVLKSNQLINKSFLYSFLHSWLGTGLLTAGGEKWKMRRRLINRTFHSSLFQDFLKVMNEQSRIFVSHLKGMALSNEKFNIFQQVTLCSLDIICETAMGKSVHAQDNQNTEYVEAIYRVNEVIQERQKSPWLWPNFIFNWTRHGRQYARNVQVLKKFTSDVLQDRTAKFDGNRNKRKGRMAFLDHLLTLAAEGQISTEGVQEEVDTFMFAGHDTTATAISWALHQIGLYPEVQHKLCEELHNVFGDDRDRDVTSDDLRKLEYMDLVIKETLRMFPSVPVIGRTLHTDCKLAGHDIPAGTECLIIPYVINNNENFWENPKRFDPERFRPENSEGRHPFAYLPFSAGPRNCIGQRFGLMEEKVVLTHFLRNYNIESCEKTEDLRLLGDIILRSKSGINVKIRKRR